MMMAMVVVVFMCGEGVARKTFTNVLLSSGFFLLSFPNFGSW